MTNKEKATSYIVKGLISLGIAVAGLYYVSKMPDAEPKYSSIEIKAGEYTLVDVNKDKKIDLIKINGINKYANQTKEMQRIFGEIPDYRFLGFYRNLKQITPEIQATADSVFNGHLNENALERVLLEGE